MNSSKKILRILFKKEMKDIFRDRKSVLMMVLVPVVLYPVIFFISFMIMSMMQSGAGVETYRYVLDGMPDSRLESELKTTRENDIKNGKNYELVFFDKNDLTDIIRESDEPALTGDEAIAYALKGEFIDAYISYSNDTYRACYNSSVTNSQTAFYMTEDALDNVKKDLVNEDLKSNGLDPEKVLNPITLDENDMATSEQSLGYFLGTIIPFMMIMSLLIGVFTPAIDAMSGEKERGTLETLLMLPVTNNQIIVSKFLSVALVGLITTILSIASMAGLGAYMLNMIQNSSSLNTGGISLSTFIPAILISIPVLIVTSLFLTAISMCVSCFAKSYKEANTYMSPVMMVVIFVCYIGFIPSIELDKTMAMIPIANVVLLIKNLLLFKVNIELILIVIVSMAVYTGLVILFLGKVYRSEAILFDEGKNGLSLLERRSNLKTGGVPSAGDGWFVLMVGFLLLMYLGGYIQTKFGIKGVGMTQIMLLLFPLLIAVYTKKDIKKTFSLKLPTPKNAIGSLILGIGAICMGMAIASIVFTAFPTEAEQTSDQIMQTLNGPGLLVFIVSAVAPGICEECLFRGYIFSAFKNRYAPAVSIALVAAGFAIYHMSPPRFPTTACVGAAFAYIVYKTGSIFPAMILHCFNNSIAIVCMYFPDFVDKYLPFLKNDILETPVLLTFIAIGVILIVVGCIIFKIGNKKQTVHE